MTRRQIALLLTAALLIVSVLVIALATFSNAPPSGPASEDSPTDDKVLTFIKNVLPLDISQYNITLKQCRLEEYEGYPIETGEYTLEAVGSTLDIIYSIENNILKICNLYVNNGSVISDRPYASINDAATSFLMKYQNYTHIDSTEMINMLSNVAPTENATITSGTLKLTVTHNDLSDTWFGDSVNFRWVQTFNGCDYLEVNLAFRDGVFSGLVDHRQLYSIGDTTVNVSMRQAVEIAMERIENYSYYMGNGVWISGFNVIGTGANLIASARKRYVLYPCWQVKLFLDKTYPGSVDGLLVLIWADSGEAFSISHFKYRWPPEF